MKQVNELFQAITNYIDRKYGMKSCFYAEVVTPPPNVTIKYANQIIPNEVIDVASHLLTEYNRTYTFKQSHEVSNYDFDNTTSSETVGDHPAHPIPKLQGSGKFESTGSGEFTLTNTLEVGAIVKVDVIDNRYFIASRVNKGGGA